MATIHCGTQLFENIQAVVFDKDGTLARSEVFLRNLAQRRARLIDARIPGVQDPLLMAFGIDGDQINPAGLMAVGTRLENAIAASAYVAETGRDWVESLQIVGSAFEEADRYMPQKAAHTPLTDGALMLIQLLHKAGVKLVLLSSDSEANVIEFMEKFELKPYFQGFYGVNQQYLTKSDPELLKQLFLCLQLPPQQTLMIGDSQVDAQIARDTGMGGCIGFTGGWSSALSIQDVNITVDQLEQIEIE